MGSFVPVLTSALVSQGVGLVASELSRNRSNKAQDAALDQLRERQSLQEQQARQDAALERERIALNAREAEEQRKSALRRAVARQKAHFGAQGVGPSGGSSQAVLLGLFDESEEDKAQREALDSLRLSALDQNLAQQKSLNVLQRAQLAEKHKLSRATTQERIVSNIAKL